MDRRVPVLNHRRGFRTQLLLLLRARRFGRGNAY
jgi:hypothetical protein